MKIFLLDLWNDLRAKRLWPVAVVLLAAVVATPVVLSKKAETPEPAPVPQPTAKAEAPEQDGPAELAQVKLEELADESGSSLSHFSDPDNPFAPPRKVMEAAREEDGASAGPVTDTGASSSGGVPSGGDINGDVTFDFGGTGGGTDVAPGGDPGDTGDTGGDTGGDPGGTKTESFTYVIDVTFSENGRTRRIKGMKKLDILPGEASPLLIFLGVSPDAGNAVFLVDSTLVAAGEGNCRPSDSECAFLDLGAGSEHEFTNEDGDSYTLRVDEIRRVKLGAKASASKRDRKRGDAPRAGAAVGRTAPARRFIPPVLADLVTVSSGAGNDSNNDTERR
jgi:hypothetical protein